jgi:hypothetical protein
MENGLFHAIDMGTIIEVIMYIEGVDSSNHLWHSGQSGIWSILYVVSTRDELNEHLGTIDNY